MIRPFITLRSYTWRTEERVKVPGIGLMHCGKLKAHLTYGEAYSLANDLTDMADQLAAAGAPEHAPSTTPDPKKDN